MKVRDRQVLSASYKPELIESPSAYTKVAVALHWVIAVALFGQLVLGWWMLDVPKSPPGLRAGWFNLHKSIGMCIALAVAVRFAWRATHPVAQAQGLRAWQLRIARLSHWLLYFCTAALPIAGLLGSMFTKYPVLFFGLHLPAWNHDWPAAKHLMSQLHLSLVWLLIALVVLHIAATARHWWRGDDVPQRMGIPRRSHLPSS
jgi:cytochrome b561